ncbi:MAG: SusC/RagA family TonB-linked outer membrane protein [Gemmatimonadota bacterium]
MKKTLFAAVCFAAFLAGTTQLAAQATGTIRGSVQDAVTGRPLSGAQVSLVGTTQGALSNDQGQFLLLNVPTGTQTVRVVFIGFRTSEQTVDVVAGQTVSTTFLMGQSAVSLDEIVVTGTAGATEKRALGNSVTHVSTEDLVAEAPIQNVNELLTARAPGVSLNNMSGQAGTAARVRIRGSGSLNAGLEPVYYVDGVRVRSTINDGYSTSNGLVQGSSPLDAIAPSDIESIEVIKGPAAATLYGAEAAGGVIQIITKRGRKGQGVQFTAELQGGNSEWALEQPMNYTLCTATGDAATLGMSESQFNSNYGNRIGSSYWPGCSSFNSSQPLSQRLLTDQPARRDPKALRTGGVYGGNVSVRGGGENYNFYIAGEKNNEEGVYYNNFSNRTGGRLNFSVTPSEQLSFDVASSYTRTHIRSPLANNASNGILRNAFRGRPGHSNSNWGEDGIGWHGFIPEISNQYDNQQYAERTILSLTANYHPFEWFQNKLTVGLDKMDRTVELFYAQDTTGVAPWGDDNATGYISRYLPVDHMWTLDYTGTINKPIDENIGSRFSAGMQVIARQRDWNEVTGWGLVTDKINVVGAAENVTADQGFSEQTSLGFFGQEQMDWQNRIFWTIALRVDDNTAFGQDFSLVYYPKASASWVISEESFFDVSWIDDLKLRGAWGMAGSAPGPGEADRTFEPGQAAADGSVVNRVVTDEYGNPNLKAESGSELELGFDASVLDGRLGVEFTYYNQHTKDALVSVSDPPSSGFTGNHLENIGEIANSGFEILLTGTPVYTRNVQWDATLSLATNSNELVDFGTDQIQELSFGSFADVNKHREGYPLGSIWSLDVERDGNGRPVLRDSDGNIVTDVTQGNVTLLDQSEAQYVGPMLPTREIGLANTITLFNNVRIFANLDYKGGNYQWCAICSIRNRSNRNTWEVNNPDMDPAERLVWYSRQTKTHIASADYLKLRELSVTFSLPESWAQQFRASRASLTLSGRNLWMWTKYFDGFDPEVAFYSRNNFDSTDYASTPMTRRLMASVRFVF